MKVISHDQQIDRALCIILIFAVIILIMAITILGFAFSWEPESGGLAWVNYSL